MEFPLGALAHQRQQMARMDLLGPGDGRRRIQVFNLDRILGRGD
jgi:hypothetical protein